MKQQFCKKIKNFAKEEIANMNSPKPLNVLNKQSKFFPQRKLQTQIF